MNIEKEKLFATLSGVFCASLIISNILAFKTFCFFGFVLPAAVILFPIVYITNDVLTEIFGLAKTKQVIITGFAMNLVAVIAYTVAIKLPYPVYFEGQKAFLVVLSNSLRVWIASMSAYLIGSLVNAKIMERMRYNSKLMMRCVLSTLVGEGIDATIFITFAFCGTMPMSQLLTMIVAQAAFKTIYEIFAYPITSKVINMVKKT